MSLSPLTMAASNCVVTVGSGPGSKATCGCGDGRISLSRTSPGGSSSCCFSTQSMGADTVLGSSALAVNTAGSPRRGHFVSERGAAASTVRTSAGAAGTSETVVTTAGTSATGAATSTAAGAVSTTAGVYSTTAGAATTPP
ncbi:MAG: hypothetical protein BWZ02_02137 [Lentisphaerae bacterium ADurb.BinA184]|nr:MAG: hypothetical protein BWZ02_02137 [Lentisphaerae bacterium ADurb.BinA184]